MGTLRINGAARTVDADCDVPLLWVLRDELGLTGTKYGCGIAQCGACTVHVDGRAARSCVTPAAGLGDREIVTIEGVSGNVAQAVQGAWRRLDSSVRLTDADVELPSLLTDRPAGSALVYLSLGSLGSADVALMKRLVGVLADTPHRFIVSKGPQHADYELPPNMWGAEFLPQTKLIPLVDLVITHGGNNTTTEAFHFGKPMIVLPLFWDQYDNAQRVDETGFGVRLPTYAFEDADLRGAIDRLLDGDLPRRMAEIGAEIRAKDGVARAAEAIEAVGAGVGAAARR